MTARRLPGPVGRAAARRSRSSCCASDTYVIAALTSSSLVGKWCCAAPRETPARSATTATVVPDQPCSPSAATAASSSRRRVWMLRSCWGSRTLVTSRLRGWVDPQVRGQVFLALAQPVLREVGDPLRAQHLVVDEELPGDLGRRFGQD